MAIGLAMEQAKHILPRLFQQAPSQLREFDLVAAYWPEMVGPLVAEHSRPVAVNAPTLVVEVFDKDWLDFLPRMRSQILSLLHEELPESPIRRIEFRPPEPPASRGRGESGRRPKTP